MQKIVLALIVVSFLFSGNFVQLKKTLLTKPNGTALKYSDIKQDILYIFRYPYYGTPAFLIKHTFYDENNNSQTKLLSYLAINPKSLNFVKEDVSMLYLDGDKIKFCDDIQSYSLKDGFNDTNASFRMSKVVLQIKKNRIYAVGVDSTKVINRFFKLKSSEIKKEFRSIWNARKRYGRRKVYQNSQFSQVTTKCGF